MVNNKNEMIIENKEPVFEKYLLSKADLTRIPIAGNFELSPICNMDCKMCYIKMTKRQVEDGGGLKSADEWLKLAKEAKETGMVLLLLTGGEVFLYKDFKYLYTELTKMGFIISINSNGTMIDENVVEWLSKMPPRCINVTLYGSSNETYERLCNNSNGFTQVSNAIDLMLKANITVKINACMTPYNKDDLEGIYKFAKDRSLKIEITSYSFPPVRRDKNLIGKGNRFTPKEAAEYKVKIKKLEYTENEFLRSSYEYLQHKNISFSKSAGSYEMQCRAGNSTFWVKWDGKMTPCGMMSKPSTEPFKEGFAEAWKRLKEEKDNIILSSKCVNCSDRNVCSVCASSAITETGAFEGTPSYICEMTKEFGRILEEELREFKKNYENKK